MLSMPIMLASTVCESGVVTHAKKLSLSTATEQALVFCFPRPLVPDCPGPGVH